MDLWTFSFPPWTGRIDLVTVPVTGVQAETPPTGITDGETFWVRSRDAPGRETEASDAYFSRHGVARSGETTAEDLPPADGDASEEIDRDALAEGKLIGKWQVTGSEARIEHLRAAIVADVDARVLWAARVVTATGHAEPPPTTT